MKTKAWYVICLFFSLSVNAQQKSDLISISLETPSNKILFNKSDLLNMSMIDISVILGKPNRLIIDTTVFRTFYKDSIIGFKEVGFLVFNKNYIYDSLGLLFKTKNHTAGDKDSISVDLFIFIDQYNYNSCYPYEIKLNAIPQKYYMGELILNNKKINMNLEDALLVSGIKTPMSSGDSEKKVILNDVNFKVFGGGGCFQINYYSNGSSIDFYLYKNSSVASLIKLSKRK